jgi:hypothetical protein
MGGDELDLTKGDPDRADKIAAKHGDEERKPIGKSRRVSNSGATRQRSTTGSKIEAELQSRLERTVDRIVAQLVARQDHELGEALSDDREQIVQGFVSITRTVKWLRNPMLMVLNLVEPALAFWRVGRIILGRWYQRRMDRAAEGQMMTPESAPDNSYSSLTGDGPNPHPSGS